MEQLRAINRLVTVEPTLFFYYLSFSIGLVAYQETLYVKFCYHDHKDLSLCTNGTWEEEHPELQAKTSHYTIYTTIVTIIPNMVCMTLLSGYSDKNSLRVALILPFIGSILTSVWITLQAVYIEWTPDFLLLAAVVWGFTGWYPAVNMACMTYVIRDPDVTNRRLRISVLEGVLAISAAAGTFIAGPIIDAENGLRNVWLISAMFNLLALLDIVFRLKRLPKPPSQYIVSHESRRCAQFRSCFNLESFKSYFVSVFRRRENSKRLHLHLVFLATMMGLLAYTGVANTQLLYLTKQYGESLTEYSIYIGICCVITLFGNTVLMYVLTTILPVSDMTLNVIGAVGAALSYGLLAYADIPAAYWTSVVFRLFVSYSTVGGRLYISHTMDSTEQAAGMGYYSTLQSIVGVTASAIFNSVYPETLSYWPGLCFGIIAMIYISTVPFYAFVKWNDNRKEGYQSL